MKTVILTPNSSVKSTATMDSHPSETRDSFYFPGCKKDANCKCEICIASINATLDLMPQSIHRSSLTKLSSSRPVRSPVSFPSSDDDLSTPKTKGPIRPLAVSPPLHSTARVKFEEKVKRRKRGLGCGGSVVRLILGLILVFGLEFGLSWVVCGVMNPRFSMDVVRSFGEKSRDLESLNSRFMFLKNGLEGLVGEKDGLLLNSKCVLYESMAEEVSIWGWPLQASGLLTAEYSSRSFTILSGRVSEWSSGEAKYIVLKANSSWEQGKWSSSVVQFDPNTWILEYRQSFLVGNPRLFSAAAEFLKFRLTREFEKMKQEFWVIHSFGSQYFDFTRESSIPIPT
ncbi:hypothetical protein BUALT_Bualt14G0094400 [Buddleja alternifolia]|uniref:C-8 sterol isomerase n=1 Tax=Buddleja alternifolia TaxID=168488 RepID=A0AAV6WMW9_9LAMI|nr:hypothetical protein BUALT_Bualt14G0094400 [Buddleja alternifolia]